MSIHVMTLVISRRFGSAIRKLIALRLADFASDDGTGIWPSRARFAAEIEVDPSTVRRNMRELEGEGLLVCIDRGGRGPGHTTEWALNLDAIAALPKAWAQEKSRSAERSRRRALCTHKGGAVPSYGGRGAAQTTTDPLGEPIPPLAPPLSTLGSRLPDDWRPSVGDRQYAISKGLTEAEVEREVEKFSNHWHAAAGKSAVKRSWAATWRNWCLRALEYRNGGAGPARGRRTFADAFRSLQAGEPIR